MIIAGLPAGITDVSSIPVASPVQHTEVPAASEASCPDKDALFDFPSPVHPPSAQPVWHSRRKAGLVFMCMLQLQLQSLLYTEPSCECPVLCINSCMCAQLQASQPYPACSVTLLLAHSAPINSLHKCTASKQPAHQPKCLLRGFVATHHLFSVVRLQHHLSPSLPLLPPIDARMRRSAEQLGSQTGQL